MKHEYYKVKGDGHTAIENAVRGFLKEHNSTHLDAILTIMQAFNTLMAFAIEKGHSYDDLIHFCDRIEDKMNGRIAFAICLIDSVEHVIKAQGSKLPVN